MLLSKIAFRQLGLPESIALESRDRKVVYMGLRTRNRNIAGAEMRFLLATSIGKGRPYLFLQA